MQLATVVGHAVSTVKHASMTGWRLLVVQPLGTGSKPDGEPVLAVDNQGARPGSKVLISSDGKGARKLLEDAICLQQIHKCPGCATSILQTVKLVFQRPTVHQLHHNIQVTILLTGIVYRYNIGVREPGN